ncbi:hypothetical protein EDB19DRAFT_1631443, partial [Suillus lakei]
SVLRQFQKSWRHPTTTKKPYSRVIRIIGVKPPKKLRVRFEKYRNKLEKRGKFSRKGMNKGNQQRRWHGTYSRRCKFYGKNLPSKGYCNDKKCAICGIVNTGIRIPKPSIIPQRFGFGIYLSSTSSKSDDYTGKRSPGAPAFPKVGVRALLLCKVAVGRTNKSAGSRPYVTSPPKGFDSVIGDSRHTGGVQYDELVVYKREAVLPSYIVVYE